MKRFLKIMLTLCLVLTLCASGAWAEATSEEIPEYDMFTLTMDNFTISENFLENTVDATHIPLSIRLGMGMDIDPVRGFMMLALTNTEAQKGLSAIGTVENNTINAHVDGTTQDIQFSVDEMIDVLITSLLPEGMTIAETTPEFQQALNDVINIIEDTFAKILAQEDSTKPRINLNIGNADVTIDFASADGLPLVQDAWRSYWVSYPTLMRAVPAGEEEITLFGEKYLAKKYTYDNAPMTYEEYEEYRAALDSWQTEAEYSFSMEEFEAAFSDALDRLSEEFYKMNGTKYTSITESDLYADYRYSDKGVFYMIEDVLGILESGSAIFDSGEYGSTTATVEAAVIYADNNFRYEQVETASDGQAAQLIMRMTEHQDGSVEIYREENMSYNYGTNGRASDFIENGTKSTVLFTEDKLTMNVVDSVRQQGQIFGNHSSETIIDLELNIESDTLLKGGFQVTVKDSGVSLLALAADVTLEAGMMPEGELLRISGKPFNPFTATEEELEALLDSLEAVIIDVLNSFSTPPQTAPGVGGALLG